MRVAMVILEYHPVLGGAQRQLESVAPLLKERGVEVHVLTRTVEGWPREQQIDGVQGGGRARIYPSGALTSGGRHVQQLAWLYFGMCDSVRVSSPILTPRAKWPGQASGSPTA